MFNKNDLIKHNFFGYGIILDSNEKTSDAFFCDGKRTIMNTHLFLEKNDFEYKKLEHLYNDEVAKELQKIKDEEEKQRSKELAEAEKEKRRIEKEQEKIRKELLKKKKDEQIKNIQLDELEKNKKYIIYNANLNKMSEFLYEDIYTIEKFRFYLKKNNIPLEDDIIDYSLYYLGYRMRTKDVVLHIRWSSIEDYFENEVCKYDRYFYHNKFNIDIYDDIIKRLEKKMVLFEASPGVYVTQKLMKKLGINQYTLKYFYDEVAKIGQELSIFTVKQLCEILNNNKIIEFASETSQIEKFVLAVPNIKSIQSDDGRYVFSFTNERFTRPLFLEMFFKNIKSIDIYELKNKIENEFQVLFNIESLIYCANNSSLYYNEEIEKVYKDKKEFLKEIFNG